MSEHAESQIGGDCLILTFGKVARLRAPSLSRFHKRAYAFRACRPPIEMSPLSPLEMSLMTAPPQRG